MPEPVSTRCPQCKAKVTLKNKKALGKKVSCPKCKSRFVARVAKEPVKKASQPPPRPKTIDDEDFTDEDFDDARLPPKTLKKKQEVTPRVPKARRKQEEEQPSRLGSIFSLFVWWNAHLAVAVCVVYSAFDFLRVLIHWNEVMEQAVIGRIAVRRLGRPLLVIVTASIIWFQAVLPRDIGKKGAVILFGGGYLFLFGLVALIIGALAESVYEKPIYAIDWSVIYLGASLLAFAFWGYALETPMQCAERLMANGYYNEALTVLDAILTYDPGNEDAVEMERALRDMIRYG